MASLQINSMKVLPGRFYHMYAFTQAHFGTILGGWAKPSDRGPDKIWYYHKGNGSVGPIRWLNNPGPFHFNDPTFVKPSGVGRETWTYMYCTALNNMWSTGKIQDAIDHNNLYFAHSTDGGLSWYGHKEIVIDTWAPTALNMGDNIRVWSMNKSGYLQSLTLDHNGWQVISPNAFCINTVTEERFIALNPDVSLMPSPGTGYRLVCNDGSLRNILYFTSTDLVNWTPWNGTDGILVVGGKKTLLSPAFTGWNLTFSTGVHSADGLGFEFGEMIMEWNISIV